MAETECWEELHCSTLIVSHPLTRNLAMLDPRATATAAPIPRLVWRDMHTNHISTLTRVWAPDAVISNLGGPFAPYKCRADLPLSAQALPGASSWAGVQLWRWWSEPDAPYRRPSTTRRAMVWTMLLIGERLDEHEELGGIPPEIWAVVLGFVRHDTPPTLAAE